MLRFRRISCHLGLSTLTLIADSGSGREMPSRPISSPASAMRDRFKVAVTVNPKTASLQVGQSLAFSATVSGAKVKTVTWSVDEVQGGSISATGVYTAPALAGTYHVRATSVADASKFALATVTVNAVLQPPTINSFLASPATITSGQGSVLSWTVSGATSLSIDQGVGTVTGTSVAVAPGATTTYTLTATNAAGATATRTATVSVQVSGSPRPRILLNDPETVATLRAALMNNTSAAARFRDMVDGELASPGSRYGFEARHAALLFQLTGNANYGNYAVGLTETFVASEEALQAANQRATIAYDSYLEVGERLGNVAQVYDWCYDLLTPAQRTRWTTYMNATLFNVWNPDQAVWGTGAFPWSGWSLNNPANNYYYSFLEATMLTGLATHPENPQAQQWREQFAIAKIQSQLIPLFNADLVGGGSREGTGYGTAMKNLFKLYFLWAKSTGERISDLTPHTRLTAYWLAHATVPTLDKLVPIGDHARESTAALFDYHRDLWLSLIAQYPEDPGVRATKQLLADSSVPQMEHSFTFWADFLYDRPSVTPLPLATLNTAYYGSGTGNLFTRSSWSKTATLAHLIAGPYTESHAHRDQGSFVLYRGDWLLDDQNRRSHSGIEQDETMHNLVRFVDGGGVVTMVEGAPQSQMVALADHPSFTYALANVLPIYNGKEQVLKSEREFLFLKPGTLVVFDRAATNSPSVARVFGLNMPLAPTVNGDLLSVANGSNRADVVRIAPLGVPWVTTAFGGTDFPLGGVRADASHSVGTESLFLHVIGTNQDVLSAVADHQTGTTGVSITFTDGRRALVRFSNAGRGGTLDFRTAANGILFSGDLPTAVTAPPLLAAP